MKKDTLEKKFIKEVNDALDQILPNRLDDPTEDNINEIVSFLRKKGYKVKKYKHKAMPAIRLRIWKEENKRETKHWISCPIYDFIIAPKRPWVIGLSNIKNVEKT